MFLFCFIIIPSYTWNILGNCSSLSCKDSQIKNTASWNLGRKVQICQGPVPGGHHPSRTCPYQIKVYCLTPAHRKFYLLYSFRNPWLNVYTNRQNLAFKTYKGWYAIKHKKKQTYKPDTLTAPYKENADEPGRYLHLSTLSGRTSILNWLRVTSCHQGR